MRLALFFCALAAMLEGVSYYECGFYAGYQAGWAKIDPPNGRGQFAWGVNAGYLYPFKPEAFIGVEGGYHDNGYSTIIKNCNEYRLESRDVELLATGTYIFFPGLWATVKWGGSRVRQIFRVWHIERNSDIEPTRVVKRWVPATTIGVGYNFCNFDIYVAYRYLFGRKNASVQAIYCGLQAAIY